MKRRYDYHNALSNIQIDSSDKKTYQKDDFTYYRDRSVNHKSNVKGNQYIKEARRNAYFENSNEIRRPRQYCPLSKNNEENIVLFKDLTKDSSYQKNNGRRQEKQEEINHQIYLEKQRLNGLNKRYSEWKQEITFTLDNLSKIEEKNTFEASQLRFQSKKEAITPVKQYILIQNSDQLNEIGVQTKRLEKNASKSRLFQRNNQKICITPTKTILGSLTEKKSQNYEGNETKKIQYTHRIAQSYTQPDDSQKENCIYNIDFKIQQPSKFNSYFNQSKYQRYDIEKTWKDVSPKIPIKNKKIFDESSIEKHRNDSRSNRSVSRGKLTVVTPRARRKQLQVYR